MILHLDFINNILISAKCPASDYFMYGSDEYQTNKYVLENCHQMTVMFRCPIMYNLCNREYTTSGGTDFYGVLAIYPP